MGRYAVLVDPGFVHRIQAKRMSIEQVVRERLADVQHEIWSHWMRYLFSQCETQDDGSVLIPAELADRWRRQQATGYQNLTEQEKDSDRHQADKVLEMLALVDDCP